MSTQHVLVNLWSGAARDSSRPVERSRSCGVVDRAEQRTIGSAFAARRLRLGSGFNSSRAARGQVQARPGWTSFVAETPPTSCPSSFAGFAGAAGASSTFGATFAFTSFVFSRFSTWSKSPSTATPKPCAKRVGQHFLAVGRVAHAAERHHHVVHPRRRELWSCAMTSFGRFGVEAMTLKSVTGPASLQPVASSAAPFFGLGGEGGSDIGAAITHGLAHRRVVARERLVREHLVGVEALLLHQRARKQVASRPTACPPTPPSCPEVP